MAHYNFPLRLLKLARDAELRGEPFMTMERAVHRVTGEPAQWFDMNAGGLAEGRRADVVVIDPERLDEHLDVAQEAEMKGFCGHIRLVRRNPDTVRAVYVSGKKAVADGEVLPETEEDVFQMIGFDPQKEYNPGEMTKMAREADKLCRKFKVGDYDPRRQREEESESDDD